MATPVRAPPERIYEAPAQADELDAWFTAGAEVDPRPGGEMVWLWVDWGRIASGRGPRPGPEARRPERYVVRRQAALGGTTVQVDFEKHLGGTVVRLCEHGCRPPTRRRAGQGPRDCATG